MTTLAELQSQLESLQKARATGAARVEYQSGETKRVTEFRSDAELIAIIADLERRIAALAGPRISTVRFSYSKGV